MVSAGRNKQETWPCTDPGSCTSETFVESQSSWHMPTVHAQVRRVQNDKIVGRYNFLILDTLGAREFLDGQTRARRNCPYKLYEEGKERRGRGGGRRVEEGEKRGSLICCTVDVSVSSLFQFAAVSLASFGLPRTWMRDKRTCRSAKKKTFCLTTSYKGKFWSKRRATMLNHFTILGHVDIIMSPVTVLPACVALCISFYKL